MHSATPLSPPVNHVFVDFENVHEIDLSIIGSKTVSFMLLLGARQTKLDADLVAKLLEHAGAVQLVRLTSSAKNSLDFALAYYVGCAVTADPSGIFHIVSKDAGYDPLIEHLRSKHIAPTATMISPRSPSPEHRNQLVPFLPSFQAIQSFNPNPQFSLPL